MALFCSSRKFPYQPLGGLLGVMRGRGVLEARKLKNKSSCGGLVWIFSEQNDKLPLIQYLKLSKVKLFLLVMITAIITIMLHIVSLSAIY